MRTSRNRVMASFATAVMVLGGASYAWACSAQARLAVQGGQTTGPVGTRLTINGTDTGTGPVEIRWDSKAGITLGEAMGPHFSINITIPQASAGAHYIVASQKVGTTTATVAFEVTAPRQANTTTTSDTVSEPTASTQPTGQTSNTANGADEGSTAPAVQPAGGAEQSSSNPSSSATPASNTATNPGSSPAASSAPAASEVTTVAGQESRSSSSSLAPTANSVAPARAQAASANPAALTTASGQVIFGGSQATAAQPETAQIAASASTVSGDTWSGFGSASTPSLLGDNLGPVPNSSGTGSAPALGVGLLGSGLVAMFAGFALAETRRKRVLAASSSR